MKLLLNWFLSNRAGLRIRLICFKDWAPFTVTIYDFQTVFICVIWFNLHSNHVKIMVFYPFPPLDAKLLKKDSLYSYILTYLLNPLQSYFLPHQALETTLVAKSNGYIFSFFITQHSIHSRCPHPVHSVMTLSLWTPFTILAFPHSSCKVFFHPLKVFWGLFYSLF